jgi:hypothetical protein
VSADVQHLAISEFGTRLRIVWLQIQACLMALPVDVNWPDLLKPKINFYSNWLLLESAQLVPIPCFFGRNIYRSYPSLFLLATVEGACNKKVRLRQNGQHTSQISFGLPTCYCRRLFGGFVCSKNTTKEIPSLAPF